MTIETNARTRSTAGRLVRRTLITVAVLAALGGGGWYGYRLWQARTPAPAAGGPSAGPRPIPAVVTAATTGSLPVYLKAPGSVVPAATVTVRSRVDGQIMSVKFTEGQVVTAGMLLAEIDPRPFQVQLAQAEGQLARDLALLQNARIDLTRYQTLFKQDSIARQQVDTQEALVRQYEGVVKSDQSQVDNAKLQLDYAKITAPIGGRIGLRMIDPGNIVRSGDTNGLAVINQVQPIYVVFTLPEDELPKVVKRLRAGATLPVDVFDRAQRDKLASGKLATIDNQIDATTGTFRLKAEFANADDALFPNQFVNARLLLDTRTDAVIVPASAVQRAGQDSLVYVVGSDNKASLRKVELGPADGSQQGISGGLTAGEYVVVDGGDRLRDGSLVQPSEPIVAGERRRPGAGQRPPSAGPGASGQGTGGQPAGAGAPPR